MKPIAHIRSLFADKFGVPRQGNLAPHVVSEIVFEAPYRNPDCVRGIEGFSHLWIIWGFHCNESSGWNPTVRPPRLGGNTRMGVFATRSPFRPNPLGLSVVKLISVEPGPVLRVSGADMVDGTPVYDIKPYVPYADIVEDARGGFTEDRPRELLQVELDCTLPQGADGEWELAMQEVLAQDPRPAYQQDAERVYHVILNPFEVSFRVQEGIAHVLSVKKV
ncbi:MAG: tRNA (N6-threonylcarbamoyladenosine(37)-N6)-methyltransferase TrmO [Akkermansia sp.]|nr:tRNA (N6-threonylcarbamoyladenosine(37)-N6)-methyltransferase TrmO [Akkermansia sp.]